MSRQMVGMESEESRGPKRIGQLLSHVLAKYGYGDLEARKELESQWREVAGEEIFARTRVGSISRGTLEILVEHPMLLSELEGFHKLDFLEQMRTRVRHTRIQSLKFRRM